MMKKWWEEEEWTSSLVATFFSNEAGVVSLIFDTRDCAWQGWN